MIRFLVFCTGKNAHENISALFRVIYHLTCYIQENALELFIQHASGDI